MNSDRCVLFLQQKSLHNKYLSISVCVSERKREREKVCVCVCVCERVWRKLMLACKRKVDSTRVVIYKACYLDEAQSRMNRATDETRTHSGRFASFAC